MWMTEKRLTRIDIITLFCLAICLIGVFSIPCGYSQGIYLFWVFGGLFLILKVYEVW
jgi:hypothetical protein